MNPVAIRTVVTGTLAVFTGFGLLTGNEAEIIAENATTLLFAGSAIWSIVAGLRWRKESK